MKYITENAKVELENILRSIQKDLSAWQQWHCLHVGLMDQIKKYHHERLRKELMDIIDRGFGDKKGMVILSSYRDIYLFCKDVTTTQLKDIAQLLAKHVFEKTNAECQMMIWNLRTDTQEIVTKKNNEEMIERAGTIISSTRVLLVEDDPVTRWMVRTALKGKCVLSTASSAGKALETYHKCKPDIVFLDINLPDVRGEELMEHIFQGDPSANIIVFSGEDNLDIAIQMMERGAKGFVSKPFTPQRLLQYI